MHTEPKSDREVSRPVTRSYLFTNELLPQELTGLKHVGDVVERTETFVFVLILLLSRDEGGRRRIWREGRG